MDTIMNGFDLIVRKDEHREDPLVTLAQVIALTDTGATFSGWGPRVGEPSGFTIRLN
jgi:hypothetical protein